MQTFYETISASYKSSKVDTVDQEGEQCLHSTRLRFQITGSKATLLIDKLDHVKCPSGLWGTVMEAVLPGRRGRPTSTEVGTGY